MTEFDVSASERPVLVDAFCCAGGAAKGYQRAGFYVVGVDINPQPHYCGDEFVQGDAVDLLRRLDEWCPQAVAVHASPPCHWASTIAQQNARRYGTEYPNLIPPTQEALRAQGRPYVIENVPPAKPQLRQPFRLCGSSFGLDLQRHRLFEPGGWYPALVPPCAHHWQTPRFRSLDKRQRRKQKLASVIGVHGHNNYSGEKELRERAMGIDWMTQYELAQAIPPSYTEWIGRQLLAAMEVAA